MNENTIPAAQEAQEQKAINDAAKAAHWKWEQENQRRIAEATRKHRIEDIKRMAIHSFCWLAGCATLIILAHIGDIAGYLMHIGTTAWSVALGIQIGKTV